MTDDTQLLLNELRACIQETIATASETKEPAPDLARVVDDSSRASSVATRSTTSRSSGYARRGEPSRPRPPAGGERSSWPRNATTASGEGGHCFYSANTLPAEPPKSVAALEG
jgi:hypothetical protein